MTELGRNLIVLPPQPRTHLGAVAAAQAAARRLHRDDALDARFENHLEARKQSRVEAGDRFGRQRKLDDVGVAPHRASAPAAYASARAAREDGPGLLWQTGGPAFAAQQLAQAAGGDDIAFAEAGDASSALAAYRAADWQERFIVGLQANVSLFA